MAISQCVCLAVVLITFYIFKANYFYIFMNISCLMGKFNILI
jgi:hypothetical protein